jgi:hypothetical protein
MCRNTGKESAMTGSNPKFMNETNKPEDTDPRNKPEEQQSEYDWRRSYDDRLTRLEQAHEDKPEDVPEEYHGRSYDDRLTRLEIVAGLRNADGIEKAEVDTGETKS